LSKYYPYQIIPHKITRTINNEFDEFILLENPKKPKKKSFRRKSLLKVSLIIVLLISGILFIVYAFKPLNEFSFGIYIFFFIIILIVAFVHEIYNSIWIWKDTYYSENLNEYQKEKLDVQIKNKLKEVKKKKVFANNLNITNYKKDLYKQVFKSYNKPLLSFKDKNKTQTEIFFSKVLFIYFQNDIKLGNYYLKDSSGGNEINYYPDIVFLNEHIAIAIEIDEPNHIVYNSHSLDTTYDKDKNSFLKKSNWAIIRFCEQQILSQPYECLIYIAEFIYRFTNNEKYLKISNINNKINLQKQERWNNETASKMFKDNFRGKYIHNIVSGNSQDKNEKRDYLLQNYFECSNHIFLTRIEFLHYAPYYLEPYSPILNNDTLMSEFYSCLDFSNSLNNINYIYLERIISPILLINETFVIDKNLFDFKIVNKKINARQLDYNLYEPESFVKILLITKKNE
jgi:hypothetical protein